MKRLLVTIILLLLSICTTQAQVGVYRSNGVIKKEKKSKIQKEKESYTSKVQDRLALEQKVRDSIRRTEQGKNSKSVSVLGFDDNGASISSFSVSSTKKVHFSRGNLQYQASSGIWRFAEHQYDCIGSGNFLISKKYEGWIDLFGWGTSGWNSGASAYQPWSSDSGDDKYHPGGDYLSKNNLTDDYAKADWGVFNAINNGGNKIGVWRTLTESEWTYLLYMRVDASDKYGMAKVAGNPGLVILPDDWIVPSGMLFTAGPGEFDKNAYTSEQWLRMESNGAVFLPAAGLRGESKVVNVGKYGNYWSSTSRDENYAFCLNFNVINVLVGKSPRFYGRSVRLVME